MGSNPTLSAKKLFMRKPLFVYGTLTIPEIALALIERPVVGTPASVDGFPRMRVKDKVFPAMVSGAGSVDGLLYSDLNDAELANLMRMRVICTIGLM